MLRKNIYCLTHNCEMYGEDAFLEQLVQTIAIITLRIEILNERGELPPSEDSAAVLLKTAERMRTLVKLRLQEKSKEAL